MEFYAAERKKELIPFATAWMELESIMLSEIGQAVRDKYQMISPLTGTQSTKEKSKQNITRVIEVKNNLTIARGEGRGDSREKGFQELLERKHGQNQGGRWKQGREVGLDGVGVRGGEKMQTTVIEQ